MGSGNAAVTGAHLEDEVAGKFGALPTGREVLAC